MYKLEQLTFFSNLDFSNLDLIEKYCYSRKKNIDLWLEFASVES